jgi:preprotein translocase subunit SecD
LIGIVIITLIAAWVDWPGNPGIHLNFAGIKWDRDIKVSEGLDLQGGMQVVLEADVPPGQVIDPSSISAAKSIVENRVNGLGVSEPLIQQQGDKRIIVELPGIRDPERAIKTFGQTGLLEFIDAGSTPLTSAMLVTTSLGGPETVGSAVETPQGTNGEPAPSTPPTDGTQPETGSTTVYNTLMTGKHLKNAEVGFDDVGRVEINFELTDEGARLFGDFTSRSVGKFMAITMDKQVISSPSIREPITGGRVSISNPQAGGIPLDEARSIVIQLKYGALPIPLKVISNRTVGPTLGQDSINKSMIAGAIGLGIVVAFMLIYYRFLGAIADLALIVYGLVVFALFKTIPVTLTLAGIAGFVLSIGMAVDANILIFERMKEELRSGKTLGAAIDAGFARAWTSIRDSNISTLITCVILFWFGSNFGASIIKGFAFTLAIGVIVSMFSAITVTRTFLRAAQQVWFSNPNAAISPTKRWLFDLTGATRYETDGTSQTISTTSSPVSSESR